VWGTDRFRGAAALDTGAASGLGEATARRFHARGAAVVLADLNEQRGRELAAELGDRADFVRVDVTSEDDVRAATERAAALGRFGITVHCAGGGIAGRTVNRDGTPHALDSFRWCIELNLVGTFNVTRLSAAAMAANEPDEGDERGVIVNTASIAGYEGQIGQIAYGSAKAGVIGMTLIACRDLGVLGIRVNAIAPGTILTPPMSMVPDAMRDAFAGQVPFPKRLGRPEEYAQLAEHFVDNRYLNGMVARLDGGTRFGPR
jgi:NAD(P)-dependent dehydrogenase (short-subunit alcohol dehydrogenase family)